MCGRRVERTGGMALAAHTFEGAAEAFTADPALLLQEERHRRVCVAYHPHVLARVLRKLDVRRVKVHGDGLVDVPPVHPHLRA